MESPQIWHDYKPLNGPSWTLKFNFELPTVAEIFIPNAQYITGKNTFSDILAEINLV